jgi:hypothetical protein
MAARQALGLLKGRALAGEDLDDESFNSILLCLSEPSLLDAVVDDFVGWYDITHIHTHRHRFQFYIKFTSWSKRPITRSFNSWPPTPFIQFCCVALFSTLVMKN